MTDKYGAYFKALSILLDILLLNLSGIAGHLVVLILPYEKIHLGLIHFLLVNFLWFNLTQLTGLYSDLFAKDAIPTIKTAFYSLFIFGFILGLVISIAADFQWYNPSVIIPFLIFSILLLFGKIGFLLWRRNSRTRWIEYKPVIILGAGSLGRELKRYLDHHPIIGYKVVGVFDDPPLLSDLDLTLLGPLSKSLDYAVEYGIKEVFCALPDAKLETIQVLMRQADRQMIRFKIVPEIKDYFRRNMNVQWFGHMTVFSARKEPLEIKLNQILKRCFDIAFSLFVIIFLLSWFFPLIAVLIKVSSPGPILFKQLRSGKDNRSFTCLKFRSMVVNHQADSLQAVKNDFRITKIGAFMRRNSIDELPQFLNVLVGDMSVVGPRPHMLEHTAAYALLIDEYMVRHLVLPGITGWAQIKGLRGETSDGKMMQERVWADIWYLENWSLFLDLKIIFLTVWHVVAGAENAH